MHRRLSKKVDDTPLPTNWVDYIQDARLQRTVPVGTRFQADLPSLMLNDKDKEKYKKESSKWLGTKIWEPKLSTAENERDDDDVGKGRPALCPCEFSCNAECIKMHILMKRIELRFELGSAFTQWKFSEMGEDVSTLWTQGEQKKFEFIVKMNCRPDGIGFLKPALISFPNRSSQSIVSYFFNVHLLRRTSKQSRSGCKIVDTDDEGVVEEVKARNTRKRLGAGPGASAGAGTSRGGRIVRTGFLGGKR